MPFSHQDLPSAAIPTLIETLFDTILAKEREIRDPFEQAFFAMVHLPYLQAFIDGNRVSHLAANLPLFQRNLSAAIRAFL